MHDPETLAFTIKIPLFFRREQKWLKSKKKEWQFYELASIWHVDPCRGPGGDDSCGWFMRSHHGDKQVLERIVKAFEFDFDRVFNSDSGYTYFCGLFCPNGDPHLSVQAIVLNLFFIAANQYFSCDGSTNWKKSRKWMQRNLFEIMMFAENPTDSLFDGITRKFEIGCAEKYTPERRAERIRGLASTIYGWILRHERPWYCHPRWHVHHWRLNIRFISQFKRWAFSRCCKCGKRFSFGYCPSTNNWNSTGPRWFKGETDVYHSDCDQPTSNCACATEPKAS